ncbi:MAG TPA: hypothetical protein VFQ88_15835 [Nevskiaceae bacterium]|nr:hypothetical protein [Nevskiaceae bacterium]
MLDPASFIWLLLPLGVALGWALARQMHLPSSSTSSRSDTGVTAQSASGRGHIPPQSSGKALSELGVTADQIDLTSEELKHVLGEAFRERGDVAHAIALHEGMIEATHGDANAADAIRLELARDYLKAGLMDRAEALLEDLVQRGAQLVPALQLSLEVYEQSHEWKRAAIAAERLQSVEGKDLRQLRAHYRCEMAEQLWAEGDQAQAQEHARRALEICPQSARASLLVGDFSEKQGDLMGARKAWQRVPQQDPRLVAEVLPRMARACAAPDQQATLSEFLEAAAAAAPDSASVTLERARLLGMRGGDAAVFLADQLAGHLHWRGLLAWLDVQSTRHPEAYGLAPLRDALRKRLQGASGYRCTSCGLTPKLLFWQCPNCKHWGTVIPDADHA